MPDILRTTALCAPLALVAGALGQATFTTLPGRPLAITPDGSTVVGSFGSNEAQTIYRWTAQGGVESIGAADAGGPWVTGVSADGGVVARSVVQGHRWTAADGWQTYYNGGPANTFGVSADGSVAVGVIAPNHQVTAVRFTGLNSYQVIGPLGSWATGVSADGSVACGYLSDGEYSRSMFRWDAASGLTDLGALLGSSSPWSSGIAISGDGSTIVGQGNQGDTFETFYWRASTGFVSLGAIPPDQTLTPTAISYDGSVIVGRLDSPGDHGGFYWSPATGLVDLEQLLLANGAPVQGWTTMEASGVSADGLTIIGAGDDAAGQVTGFIATIPAPATLLALGAAIVVLRRRRE